jgi:hypothetical protein
MVYTYSDAVESVLDFLGSKASSDGDVRQARRAVLAAARDLANVRDWSWYRAFGTIAVVAGTAIYALPADVRSIGDPLAADGWWGMRYVPPAQWLADDALLAGSTGTPEEFTIVPSPTLPGRLAVRFFPTPDADRTLRFWYQRTPRALAVYRSAVGTASVALHTTSVIGVGTAWTSALDGSVLRLSPSSRDEVTSDVGPVPPALEGTIASVGDATHLTLAVASQVALSGVRHAVSDPVDVEPGSMLSAFQRGCELQACLSRPVQDRLSPTRLYEQALRLAAAGDMRSAGPRTVGVGYTGPLPLRYRGPIVW